MGKTQLCIVCRQYIGLRGWGNHVNMHTRNLGSSIYDEVRKSMNLPARKPQKRLTKAAIQATNRILLNHRLEEYDGR